jgi:hypothetical protein
VGTKWIVALVVGVLSASLCIVSVLMVYLPAEHARISFRAQEAQVRAIERALETQQRKLDAEYEQRINSTTDEAERARLRFEMQARRPTKSDVAPVCPPCPSDDERRGRCAPCTL